MTIQTFVQLGVICLSAAVAMGQEKPLTTTPAGAVVRLSLPTLAEIPAADLKITLATRSTPLIFSDNPEYFTGDGIALREKVEAGRFRFYVYHVPERSGAKKVISAVIENPSDRPLKVHFARYGFQQPGKDYLKIGKAGLVDYLSERAGPPDQIVAPHARAVLDPAMDRIVVGKDDLVHAFHEIEIDGPAIIYTIQRDPSADSVKSIAELRTLATTKSGAGRGKFTTTDFDASVSYDTASGAQKIVVADGKTDPWIVGRDGIAEAESINKGNYGVMYHLRIHRKSSDGKALMLVMVKPQDDSNKYCPGTAAAVKVSDGIEKGGVVALPRDAVNFKQFPQAVVIGCFAPAPEGKTETIELTYSPPGASCLPTPILLVPYQP